MEYKRKLVVWTIILLGILTALFYFVLRPFMYPLIQTDPDTTPRETPKSIQEKIREELIAPQKSQTPTPTEILRELSAPPLITSSPASPRPSATPSPQQVLDSLLGPR